MTNEQFDIWCINNQISKEARQFIQDIRNSAPDRNVGGGIKNMPGRYTSRKMGFTIQFESNTLEFPFIYKLEYDPAVMEFYDQPRKITLDYQSIVKGKPKRKVFEITPDFFVINESGAELYECKTEEELETFSEKDPYRIYKDLNGSWRCPPGEAFAEKFGLGFKIFSSNQIEWELNRNMIFLNDYLNNPLDVSDDVRSALVEIVTNEPGILLRDLLQAAKEPQIAADNIYTLVSHGGLYVDLKKYVLAEPQYARVFTDPEKAAAYVHIESTSDSISNTFSGVELQIGKIINWDGKPRRILNIGDTTITLGSDDNNVVDLTYNQLDTYTKQGKISGLNTSQFGHPEIYDAYTKANEQDSKIANDRLRMIQLYLHGEVIKNSKVSLRTIRLWVKKYRLAEQAYGNGFIGLYPQHREKGNRTKRLETETQKMMEEWILNKYETIKQKKKFEVYSDFLLECQQQNVRECSYKTFVNEIRKRPTHEQEKKRKGEKAAYKFESFYLEFQATTIRHGDRPFEIAHIDHTQLDIELIDSQTKRNLARPWVTFMTDAYTRRILALYLTYDQPSYRSCMMVLRECVRRHSRLPDCVVVDGGREFSSTYFETVLAAFRVTKKQRPAGKSRYGSVLERLFGKTNTQFVHNLVGNTQSTKDVRQLTKKTNPKINAIWTFEKLLERLNQYAYDIHDQLLHPALGNISPRDAFLIAKENTGERAWIMIPYDETFRILTLPSSSKGTAKIEVGRGFKHANKYYWADAFRDAELERKQVPIRYDPYNVGIAYAYVKKRWVSCMSDHFAVFNGKTEKQIQIASAELKKKYQTQTKHFKFNAKILADFLRECESDEVLLQQMKDREVLGLKVIQGGKTAPTTEQSTAPSFNSNQPEQKKVISKKSIFDLDEPFQSEDLRGRF